MRKIILYYKFVPLADPQAVMLWQKTLTESLSLGGRIILSSDGINGTLGGETKDIKAYISANKQFEPLKDIKYKWSDGSLDKPDFPRMSIKVREEIVTFNAKQELKVTGQGIVGGGKKLKAQEVHELVAKYDDVVFFDGRSQYEANVGRFKDAITPPVRTAKDFIPILESGVYDHLKDKKVVTYCTGGIRCEVLSMLMKNRGFKDVYQLDGGIVKYGEKFGDDGLWQGSLYVFDGRMGHKFSDKTKDIGKCIHCGARTSNYENCVLKSCNDLVLICKDCLKEPKNLYHSLDCKVQDEQLVLAS